jgi:hypothetical protein
MNDDCVGMFPVRADNICLNECVVITCNAVRSYETEEKESLSRSDLRRV